jgi:RNA chaperone Hfq
MSNNNVFKSFVQTLIDCKVKVNVYLISGIKLVGTITEADDSGLILSEQFVNRSAISTISEVVTKA